MRLGFTDEAGSNRRSGLSTRAPERESKRIPPRLFSEGRSSTAPLLIALFSLSTPFSILSQTFAAEPPPGASAPPGGPAESKTNKPEEEDYSGTPFTEYGEFNESSDEEADARFFQYGRMFGVSLGLGFQFVDGFRGSLWQGGFPAFDFKLHYWFNFNVALDLGVTTAQHFFNTRAQNQNHTDVNMLRIGVDLKYYFDTKDLSAPISFASPYLLLGGGSFSKTQLNATSATQDPEMSMGLSAGAGLEFVAKPRKIYFTVEYKMSMITFKDTYTSNYTTVGLPNLTGNFHTLIGSVLFTW